MSDQKEAIRRRGLIERRIAEDRVSSHLWICWIISVPLNSLRLKRWFSEVADGGQNFSVGRKRRVPNRNVGKCNDQYT